VLVRVHTGIVEAEVILVGLVPAEFLGGGHDRPPPLALFLDGTLGNLVAEVIGNDRTGCLHVKKIRGKRALGRIGIVSALLPLLLLLNRGLRGRESSRNQVGERAGNAFQLAAILKVGALADE
jgi:hypothetical protein